MSETGCTSYIDSILASIESIEGVLGLCMVISLCWRGVLVIVMCLVLHGLVAVSVTVFYWLRDVFYMCCIV